MQLVCVVNMELPQVASLTYASNKDWKHMENIC